MAPLLRALPTVTESAAQGNTRSPKPPKENAIMKTTKVFKSALVAMVVIASSTVCASAQGRSLGEFCDGPMSDYEDRGDVWYVSAQRAERQFRKALCDARDRNGAPITIQLDDKARINLSREYKIPIPGGVRLKSGRTGLNPGALIYSNSLRYPNESRERPLFVIREHDVRIEGLRLRGPSGSSKRRDKYLHAIKIEGALDIHIEGNEIYNFTGAGVHMSCYYPSRSNPCGKDIRVDRLRPGRIRPETAHRIRVTRNYIHHNASQGRGYGVQIHQGAYALIDKNTFGANRHHVASGGEPYTGYIATLNFVESLPAQYCRRKLGNDWCWQEHHFDMHGDGKNREGNEGGVGGEFVEIAYNTIHGAQEYYFKTRAAFDLRGEPMDEVLFHHNVLSHGSRGDAIRESWKAHKDCRWCPDAVNDFDNQYGGVSDPFTKGAVTGNATYGTLDFDGDGKRDAFYATGAAWYYRSGQKTEWRYLNKSSIKLDDILSLADHDGNGKTDVLRMKDGKRLISRDGVGKWETLESPPPPSKEGGACTEAKVGNPCGETPRATCKMSMEGAPECALYEGRLESPRCLTSASCAAGQTCVRYHPKPGNPGRCYRRIVTWVIE